MPSEDVIKVEGTVAEVLPGRICKIVLPNGHRLLGHVSQKMQEHFAEIAVGQKVNLEMSPYDLSKGRIILKEK
ncbi:MAG: translation initiation factor IF-1 [Verrucomicrobiota bacterium]